MTPILLDRTIKSSHFLRENQQSEIVYKNSAGSSQLGMINQIDVARILFIFVCVRVCVLFYYWLSHFIAIVHRWIIG